MVRLTAGEPIVSVNYRALAHEALARAQKEVESEDPNRLRYAALELRGAMEAITYSRLESYKNELPRDMYITWQPRKLLEHLAEIDPEGTFLSSTFSYSINDESGKSAEVMSHLGTEWRLTIKDLKTHYDALGSFLHIPTIDQLQKNKILDPSSLQRRCSECIEILCKVLKSTIWNRNIGQFVEIECLRCQKEFRWRYNADAAEPMHARCIHCNAIHLLTREDGRLRIVQDWQEVKCPTPNCEGRIGVWRDEMQPGRWWTCDCGKSYILVLGLQELPPPQ